MRLRLLALLALVATVPLLLAAPAAADRTDPEPASGSSAVVTRLTLADGKGGLTVHVRAGSRVTGFGVLLGTGLVDPGITRLSGPRQVAVPGTDVVCVNGQDSAPSTYISYACSLDGDTDNWDEPVFMAPGYHRVTIPITYAGRVTRPMPDVGYATVRVYQRQYQFSFEDNWDTFPVVGPSHFQSTAEIAAAPATPDLTTSSTYDGDLVVSTSLDLVPGEAATELEIQLPRGHWRLTGTNATRLGLQCFVRQDQNRIHCRAAPGRPRALPSGRRDVVTTLHVTDLGSGHSWDPGLEPVDVRLTVDGVRDEVDQYEGYWR